VLEDGRKEVAFSRGIEGTSLDIRGERSSIKRTKGLKTRERKGGKWAEITSNVTPSTGGGKEGKKTNIYFSTSLSLGGESSLEWKRKKRGNLHHPRCDGKRLYLQSDLRGKRDPGLRLFPVQVKEGT